MAPPHPPELAPAPFTDEDAERAIAGDTESPAARWSITDLGSAEWAMARLAEARSALDEVAALEQEWAQRVAEWATEQRAPHARFSSFLEGHLERYALELRRANPKHATTKVPSGKVATRRVEARPVVANDEAVLDWLDQRDEVPDGAIKRSPLVSKLKGVLAVVDRPTGRVVAEVGCCGAVLTVDPEGFDGSVGLCSVCGASNPEVLDYGDEEGLAVIDVDTGEPVPGFTVVPGHYSTTITVNNPG